MTSQRGRGYRFEEMTMTEIAEKTQSAYAFPLLIKHLLFSPIAHVPHYSIVYRDKTRYTYAEFHRRVARLANALTEMGVKPGDTVAVMDWDSNRYLELYFAVPMLGAILHTVNVRLPVEQLLYTINHAEDDYVFILDEFIPMLEQIRGRIDMVKGMRKREYEELLSQASDSFTFSDFDENRRATTFYTTGTTGMPKGVFFSHRQIVLHTLGTLLALSTAEKQGRFHKNDVYMPMTPMFHVHAWGFPYIATFAGVKQVYPGKYAPGTLLHLLEKEGVTFSHCVPTIVHMLINDKNFAQANLAGCKFVIGGAAMAKAQCKALLAKGVDVFTGYGMSETCPVLTISQVDEEDLSEEAEVEIRCKTGRTLPLVGGEWLSSLELEDVISSHPGVSEVAVVGKTDEKWGQRPLGLVVGVGEVTGKEIIGHVKDFIAKGLLSKQALLLEVQFVDAIDKTGIALPSYSLPPRVLLLLSPSRKVFSPPWERWETARYCEEVIDLLQEGGSCGLSFNPVDTIAEFPLDRVKRYDDYSIKVNKKILGSFGLHKIPALLILGPSGFEVVTGMNAIEADIKANCSVSWKKAVPLNRIVKMMSQICRSLGFRNDEELREGDLAVAFCIHCCHATAAGSGYRLAVDVILDISTGKNPGYIGFATLAL
ncbi:unnamed protein product, partial [Cyprideis torosa]